MLHDIRLFGYIEWVLFIHYPNVHGSDAIVVELLNSKDALFEEFNYPV